MPVNTAQKEIKIKKYISGNTLWAIWVSESETKIQKKNIKPAEWKKMAKNGKAKITHTRTQKKIY